MARYSNLIKYPHPHEKIISDIAAFLKSEGYRMKTVKGEEVYKRSNSLWTGPTYIRVYHRDGGICVEAWVKYAVLPGVYVGEMSIDGFVGAASKEPLRARVRKIEKMIEDSIAKQSG